MKITNMGLHLICCYVLAVILLHGGSQTIVEAVDIEGFSDSTACSGAGYTFPGIAQRVCTDFGAGEGSVQFRNLRDCQTARLYNGGGCTTQVASGNGPNVLCYVGGGFTGADWLDGC